jgi:hypothetical protein
VYFREQSFGKKGFLLIEIGVGKIDKKVNKMAIKYTNFRGDTYYLHKGKTKKGNPKYFFSMKQDRVLAEYIPKSYEIYENPNGMVFLRKIVSQKVTDEEVSIVENGVRKFAKLEHFKIAVKGKSITVYLPDQNLNSLVDCLSGNTIVHRSKLEEEAKELLTFSPMVRFVLEDEENRKFVVERMCFLDPEGWMFLDGHDDLAKLVKEYSQHLGKDSFFELM